MTKARYASPQALRHALRDRLREMAAQRPHAELSDLLRQFAYDRLLARVFTAEPDRWVLKGAAAMLARLPVVAYLGPTEFASFHADLVASLSMTGEPEAVPPLIDIDLGLARPKYRAYPVADHIADKLCAMLEIHPRASGKPATSTRYRDLVDLATFARSSEVDGEALAIALRSEFARRGLALPERLPDPPGPDWRAGYARSVRDAPGLLDRDLDSALATVRSLLDPVLAGERIGRWDPTRLSWTT